MIPRKNFWKEFQNFHQKFLEYYLLLLALYYGDFQPEAGSSPSGIFSETTFEGFQEEFLEGSQKKLKDLQNKFKEGSQKEFVKDSHKEFLDNL